MANNAIDKLNATKAVEMKTVAEDKAISAGQVADLIAKAHQYENQYEPISKPDFDSLLSDVESIKDETLVSEDGDDISPRKWWATQEEHDLIDEAIQNAHNLQKPYTQEELDAAYHDLLEAMARFRRSRARGNTPNKNQLQNAITDAKELLDSLVTSEDGNDVPPSQQWVDEETWNNLQSAIQEAKDAINNPDLTVDQMNDILQNLESMKQAAENAKQGGTPVDKDGAQGSLGDAKDILGSATPSKDGNDVPPSEQWVPEDKWNDLDQAIKDVENALKDPNTTQDDLNEKLDQLEKAKDAFEQAKQNGITPDKTNLLNAIQEAKLAKDIPSTSTNGNDISPNKTWVTNIIRAALANAISEAETVYDSDNVTANQVDEATKAIKEALSLFNSLTKNGTDPDKNTLLNTINTAIGCMLNVKKSDDGSDVYIDEEWVISSVYDELQIAIISAQSLYQNVDATYDYVSLIISDLNNKIEKFNSNKQFGNKKKTKDFVPGTPLSNYSWEDLESWADDVYANQSKYQELIGQTKTINISGYGNVDFRLVALCHNFNGNTHSTPGTGYPLAYTWQATKSLLNLKQSEESSSNSLTPNDCGLGVWLRNTLLPLFPDDVSQFMESILVEHCWSISAYNNDPANTPNESDSLYYHGKLWLPSMAEICAVTNLKNTTPSNGSNSYPFITNGNEGSIFDYWKSHTTLSDHIITNLSGEKVEYWTRSLANGKFLATDRRLNYINTSGSASVDGKQLSAEGGAGIVPCFCTGKTSTKVQAFNNFGPGKKLDDVTWGDIYAKRNDAMENPSKYYNLIGTSKKFACSNKEYHAVLVDVGMSVNSNTERLGGFYFVVEELYERDVRWDNQNTVRENGYKTALINGSVEGVKTWSNKLPSILRAFVYSNKFFLITQKSPSNNPSNTKGTILSSEDYSSTFWVPSASELSKTTHMGSTKDSYSYSGNYYPFIEEANTYKWFSDTTSSNYQSRIRKHKPGSSTYEAYWTRSISDENPTTSARYVNASGVICSGAPIGSSMGLCMAFSI